jgi:hypothetical protein
MEEQERRARVESERRGLKYRLVMAKRSNPFCTSMDHVGPGPMVLAMSAPRPRMQGQWKRLPIT